MIGILEDLQPLQTIITKEGPKDVVKFMINDGSCLLISLIMY